MGIQGGEKLIGKSPGLAINPLSRTGLPKGLERSHERPDIVYSLRSVFPVDAVIWRQMADERLPCLREFIMFDIEVGDYSVPGRTLLDYTGEVGEWTCFVFVEIGVPNHPLQTDPKQ